MKARKFFALLPILALSTAGLAAEKGLTYSNLAKGLFGVTSASKAAPTYLFVGKDASNATCGVTAYFHPMHGSYSDIGININVPNDDDSLAGIQVQYNAGIKVKQTEDGYTFTFRDNTCSGTDVVEAKFSKTGYALKNLTDLKTDAGENSCHAGQPLTHHVRVCNDLNLVVALTDSVEAKIQALVKKAVAGEMTEDDEPKPVASYIDSEHEEGCWLDLETTQLQCSYVIDEDMGNDSSPLKVAQIEIKDGQPTKVVKTWDSNKWDE